MHHADDLHPRAEPGAVRARQHHRDRSGSRTGHLGAVVRGVHRRGDHAAPPRDAGLSRQHRNPWEIHKMKSSFVSLAALFVAGGLSGAALAQSRSTYIVQLAGEPQASYGGSVSGYAATRPAPGARFNGRSPAAQRYAAYLDAQQRSVAATVAGAPIVARYATVYNGFA